MASSAAGAAGAGRAAAACQMICTLPLSIVASITSTLLDVHSRFNWTNEHGGPIVHRGDPLPLLVGHPAPSAPAPSAPVLAHKPPAPGLSYGLAAGFLAAGDDLSTLEVTSLQPALDACSAQPACRGLTFAGNGTNGSIAVCTTVYLKKGSARVVPKRELVLTPSFGNSTSWWSWIKQAAVVTPPVQVVRAGSLVAGLRAGSFSVQWLNLTRRGVDNFSVVPALSASSALPLVHHLGDVTLRVRRAAAGGGAGWDYYASAWGPFHAEATPVPLRKGEAAAHDITPLLDATAAPDAPAPAPASPVRVRRAYAVSGAALELRFELRNAGTEAVEVGGFGMAMPAGVSQDVHVGQLVENALHPPCLTTPPHLPPWTV